MTKEKEHSKNFVTTPVAELVSLSHEDLISVQNLENCIKMIDFFRIFSDDHVKQDLDFLQAHFYESLETELMDDVDERKKMISLILQKRELRKITKELPTQSVIDSLQFLVTLKKTVIASNPKKHGNE